ncbi:MAG: hypothetical protein GY856_22280 [bacterium]|nr:hypothetical protein [bacterium]
MPRFNIAQWCDFIRGVADPAVEGEMRAHLESGASRARRQVELLGLVASVGRTDLALAIPDYAVRGAKAIGSLRRSHQVPTLTDAILRYLPFSITFDSQHQPAPVGTRDIQSTNRQLIFKAEDFTVDVQIEHEADPPATVVVGQLLRCHGTTQPVPEVPVFVVSGDRIVGRSLTGRFGEFQAEGLPREALDLCLVVAEKECLKLPMGTEQVGVDPNQ